MSAPRFRVDGDTYYLDDDSNPYDAAKGGADAFLFTFGAYGSTRVLVYRSAGYKGLEDGLEVAAATLADEGMTGHVMPLDDPHLKELYKEAREEGYDDEEAWEQATAALTYTEAGYLTSYEWFVNDLAYGSEVYGAGVAKWVEDHPDWMDFWTYTEIAAMLKKAGASQARIDRAIKAVEKADG